MKSPSLAFSFLLLAIAAGGPAFSQTVYIPSGTSGIGSSSTGNVGIGTTSPFVLLDVNSSSTGDVEVARFLNPNIGIGNYGYINVGGTDASGSGVFLGFKKTGTGTGIATLAVRGSGGSMSIDESGNVGIGTSNPTQKLSVAGTIRAYEVIVDTGWSDYVFADDYRLAPLSEVERHITAEKHLPGIPSAAEVAAHGVSMGAMQSKLLAKVEELTLHLIAQGKVLVELKNENSALKIRLTKLESDKNLQP